MDLDRYIDSLVADSERLASAARRGLDPEIPSCPRWNVAKVLLHTGLVHRNVAELVVGRSTEPWDFASLPRAPEGVARVDWFEEGAAALVEALREVDAGETVWNFVEGRGPAEFWHRRMAQETSIHRHDAEEAHGDAHSIDPDLAADGVDELLTVLLGTGRVAAELPGDGLGGTLHLHCTDEPGEWVVDLRAGEAEVERRHAKADAAVRGPASDLDLFVWNRIPAADLDVVGDAAVAERWAMVQL